MIVRTIWQTTLAGQEDIPTLESLIPLSVRALQAAWYSPEQMQAALGPVFGVDRQLIEDQTYYVVRHEGMIVGAGGWSRRKSLYGGDHARIAPDPLLDPAGDPARIRAFFVHPDWSRRGIGRALLQSCETAIELAGFASIELVATLAGEPLYLAAGYHPVQRLEINLPNGLLLPGVKMAKALHHHKRA